MSWFRRRLNRWRNYFSSGDYAGSHGGGSTGPSQTTQSVAYRESAIADARTRGSVGPGG
jgi:hypothetical protein